MSMLTRIAALVTALDQVEQDQEAMRGAAQKFQSILEVQASRATAWQPLLANT